MREYLRSSPDARRGNVGLPDATGRVQMDVPALWYHTPQHFGRRIGGVERHLRAPDSHLGLRWDRARAEVRVSGRVRVDHPRRPRRSRRQARERDRFGRIGRHSLVARLSLVASHVSRLFRRFQRTPRSSGGFRSKTAASLPVAVLSRLVNRNAVSVIPTEGEPGVSKDD